MFRYRGPTDDRNFEFVKIFLFLVINLQLRKTVERWQLHVGQFFFFRNSSVAKVERKKATKLSFKLRHRAANLLQQLLQNDPNAFLSIGVKSLNISDQVSLAAGPSLPGDLLHLKNQDIKVADPINGVKPELSAPGAAGLYSAHHFDSTLRQGQGNQQLRNFDAYGAGGVVPNVVASNSGVMPLPLHLQQQQPHRPTPPDNQMMRNYPFVSMQHDTNVRGQIVMHQSAAMSGSGKFGVQNQQQPQPQQQNYQMMGMNQAAQYCPPAAATQQYTSAVVPTSPVGLVPNNPNNSNSSPLLVKLLRSASPSGSGNPDDAELASFVISPEMQQQQQQSHMMMGMQQQQQQRQQFTTVGLVESQRLPMQHPQQQQHMMANQGYQYMQRPDYRAQQQQQYMAQQSYHVPQNYVDEDYKRHFQQQQQQQQHYSNLPNSSSSNCDYNGFSPHMVREQHGHNATIQSQVAAANPASFLPPQQQAPMHRAATMQYHHQLAASSSCPEVSLGCGSGSNAIPATLKESPDPSQAGPAAKRKRRTKKQKLLEEQQAAAAASSAVMMQHNGVIMSSGSNMYNSGPAYRSASVHGADAGSAVAYQQQHQQPPPQMQEDMRVHQQQQFQCGMYATNQGHQMPGGYDRGAMMPGSSGVDRSYLQQQSCPMSAPSTSSPYFNSPYLPSQHNVGLNLNPHHSEISSPLCSAPPQQQQCSEVVSSNMVQLQPQRPGIAGGGSEVRMLVPPGQVQQQQAAQQSTIPEATSQPKPPAPRKRNQNKKRAFNADTFKAEPSAANMAAVRLAEDAALNASNALNAPRDALVQSAIDSVLESLRKSSPSALSTTPSPSSVQSTVYSPSDANTVVVHNNGNANVNAQQQVFYKPSPPVNSGVGTNFATNNATNTSVASAHFVPSSSPAEQLISMRHNTERHQASPLSANVNAMRHEYMSSMRPSPLVESSPKMVPVSKDIGSSSFAYLVNGDVMLQSCNNNSNTSSGGGGGASGDYVLDQRSLQQQSTGIGMAQQHFMPNSVGGGGVGTDFGPGDGLDDEMLKDFLESSLHGDDIILTPSSGAASDFSYQPSSSQQQQLRANGSIGGTEFQGYNDAHALPRDFFEGVNFDSMMSEEATAATTIPANGCDERKINIKGPSDLDQGAKPGDNSVTTSGLSTEQQQQRLMRPVCNEVAV